MGVVLGGVTEVTIDSKPGSLSKVHECIIACVLFRPPSAKKKCFKQSG